MPFLTLAQNYLHTSKTVLRELCTNENKWIYTSDDDRTEEEYDEATKWSDFNVLIPSFFLFYHGVELLIKGLIYAKKDEEKIKSHKINELFDTFLGHYENEEVFKDILSKYVRNDKKVLAPLIVKLLQENGIDSPASLYEIFRYPTDNTFNKRYRYSSVKYKQEEILSDIEKMTDDIDLILRESVRIYSTS